MFVMGVEGGFGQGKTLTAVIKAHQWAAASGAKIFANFAVRDAYLFDSYTDWYKIADVHGSILIFDESQSNWDNRKWGNSGQIEMTQVLNFVRKMNSLFIFILPNYENIESRVRQMTDIVIKCQKTQGGTIINHVYDYQESRLLNKWVLPKRSQQEVFKQNLYSTHSFVNRFPTPPPNKVDEFFKTLESRHELALRRYRKDFTEIQTLSKEELDLVTIGG
jgi:hypothetical protein